MVRHHEAFATAKQIFHTAAEATAASFVCDVLRPDFLGFRLTEEIRLPMFISTFLRYWLRPSFQHLILHVTQHCNLRCEHCFVDFGSGQNLPLEVYQRFGRDIGPLFWLDISGGEPFLRHDLADIVLAFDAKVVQIPTNASFPDAAESQLEKLRAHSRAKISVSLSLDGLKTTHEAIRKAPGNWDQVWSTYERLRALKGISVKINTVLTVRNAPEILTLMDQVWERQPDFHSVILLRGEPRRQDLALPRLPELRHLAQEVLKRQRRYTYGQNPLNAYILRNYHRYLWQLSIKTLEERRQIIPCLGGQAHAVCWADGSISSCEMLSPVGNITEQSWRAIISSPAFLQQVQDIGAGKCYCTHNCAMLDSILFRPASCFHLLGACRREF